MACDEAFWTKQEEKLKGNRQVMCGESLEILPLPESVTHLGAMATGKKDHEAAKSKRESTTHLLTSDLQRSQGSWPMAVSQTPAVEIKREDDPCGSRLPG